MSTNQFSDEVALAERYALLQRIAIYPSSVRREVVRLSLLGMLEMRIATQLEIPLVDVHAILEAFNLAEEHAHEDIP